MFTKVLNVKYMDINPCGRTGQNTSFALKRLDHSYFCSCKKKTGSVEKLP